MAQVRRLLWSTVMRCPGDLGVSEDQNHCDKPSEEGENENCSLPPSSGQSLGRKPPRLRLLRGLSPVASTERTITAILSSSYWKNNIFFKIAKGQLDRNKLMQMYIEVDSAKCRTNGPQSSVN